jgi:hypothetical protein
MKQACLSRLAAKSAAASSIICLSFKVHRSGSLIGFADFHLLKLRLKLRGCAVHQSGDRRWVQLPARPRLDLDQNPVRDDRGKLQYLPMIEWDSDAVRQAFSDLAVEAVLGYAPGAFDGEAR